MSERKRFHENARRRRLLAAGMCCKCMGPRCAVPGYTSDRCSDCAARDRASSLARMRKKRGTSSDLPLTPGKRGPRASLASSIERSDEHKPETYKPLRPARKKRTNESPPAEPTPMPAKPKPPIMYGSLTLDDIRRATSALPLKPPGKR